MVSATICNFAVENRETRRRLSNSSELDRILWPNGTECGVARALQRQIIETKQKKMDTVHAFSDCVTSYDLKKLPEMLAYYAKQGCEVITLNEI